MNAEWEKDMLDGKMTERSSPMKCKSARAIQHLIFSIQHFCPLPVCASSSLTLLLRLAAWGVFAAVSLMASGRPGFGWPTQVCSLRPALARCCWHRSSGRLWRRPGRSIRRSFASSSNLGYLLEPAAGRRSAPSSWALLLAGRSAIDRHARPAGVCLGRRGGGRSAGPCARRSAAAGSNRLRCCWSASSSMPSTARSSCSLYSMNLRRDLTEPTGGPFRFLVGGMQTNLTTLQVTTAGTSIGIGFLLLLLISGELNVAALSEAEAEALGVRIQRLRWLGMIAASLVTASAVSISGPIGFVGLVCPHLARLLAGSDQRKLLPVSTALGAGLLAVADAVSRGLIPRKAPGERTCPWASSPAFSVGRSSCCCCGRGNGSEEWGVRRGGVGKWGVGRGEWEWAHDHAVASTPEEEAAAAVMDPAINVTHIEI